VKDIGGACILTSVIATMRDPIVVPFLTCLILCQSGWCCCLCHLWMCPRGCRPPPWALSDAAPTFVPVVPCMPVVGELVAEPLGAPAAVLFGEEVLLGGGEDWASAAPESASANVNAISPMCCASIRQDNPLLFCTFRNAQLFLYKRVRPVEALTHVADGRPQRPIHCTGVISPALN
jgi:hypothetical protein